MEDEDDDDDEDDDEDEDEAGTVDMTLLPLPGTVDTALLPLPPSDAFDAPEADMSTARCLLRAGVDCDILAEATVAEAAGTVVHVLIAAREVGEAEPGGEVRDVLDILDL